MNEKQIEKVWEWIDDNDIGSDCDGIEEIMKRCYKLGAESNGKENPQ